ncbi:hypothetical protein JDV02_005596 [Purpureocillium takamizusanense]|uniref:Uncharacterized protein n=1 Tax=Purpureocillium takamizusanense TaxID=2060973 RepID=A0A9Q8VC27_9HYPO|nr:uncharacterized protein JDV02_005596 [Purpureocillium takamizusanense]UNI19412.1 hypothetical protein JDV02_005596 [Purpureocillium takamizusanense]
MGLGFGLNLSTILIMAPMIVREKDMPVTMAAVTQIRVVGGTIGLAVCSARLKNHLKTGAREFLTPEQIRSILTDISNITLLPQKLQHQSRSLFAAGYSQQMRVMMYFSIVSLLSVGLLFEKHPRRFPAIKTGQVS